MLVRYYYLALDLLCPKDPRSIECSMTMARGLCSAVINTAHHKLFFVHLSREVHLQIKDWQCTSWVACLHTAACLCASCGEKL